MAALAELRKRSDKLFTRLLEDQTEAPKAAGAKAGFAAPRAKSFSWFDPKQSVAAAALSLRLSALVASKDDARDGLAAALDQVDAEIAGSRSRAGATGTGAVRDPQQGRPPAGEAPHRRGGTGAVRPARGQGRRAPSRSRSAAWPRGWTTGARTCWPTSTTSTGTRSIRSPAWPRATSSNGWRTRDTQESVAILNALQPNPELGETGHRELAAETRRVLLPNSSTSTGIFGPAA